MDFFTLPKIVILYGNSVNALLNRKNWRRSLKPRVWHRQPIIISLFAFMCLKARMPLPRSVN